MRFERRRLTVCIIVLRRAQCLVIGGEETPEAVIRGRLALLESLGRDGLRQGVFRNAELELGTGAVNCRDAARLAQVAAVAGDSGRGRKVGALDGPDRGEVKGGSEVRWG